MTHPVADQIRQLRSGHPIVLAQRPLRLVGIALGSLVFTAAGVLMIIAGVQEATATSFHAGIVFAILLGLVTVGLFGVLGLGGLALVTIHPHRLVLTAEGFREEVRRHGEWQTTGRVSWSEITAVTIDHIPLPKLPGKGLPVLAYDLTEQGIERIHSEKLTRHPGARSGKKPPARILMRTVFGSARRLCPLFEAAHREFSATFPAR